MGKEGERGSTQVNARRDLYCCAATTTYNKNINQLLADTRYSCNLNTSKQYLYDNDNISHPFHTNLRTNNMKHTQMKFNIIYSSQFVR